MLNLWVVPNHVTFEFSVCPTIARASSLEILLAKVRTKAMTDSDSDSDEFDLPPMISLEDLVGPSNAEVVATTRVIFPRCDATPAELAAVESHLRRCLAYPVIAYAPAFEGRCELLLAILDELRRNDSNTGDDPAPPEPLGEEAPE